MLSKFRRSSRRDVRFVVLLLVLLTDLTVPALAQVSNAVVTGIVTDEQRGILPKQYQQVVTIPASMGGGTIIGTSIYRFPSLIWGTYQCLPPCVAGAGTRTTFTEAQEALSITTGKHSWKLGGSIQLFPILWRVRK